MTRHKNNKQRPPRLSPLLPLLYYSNALKRTNPLATLHTLRHRPQITHNFNTRPNQSTTTHISIYPNIPSLHISQVQYSHRLNTRLHILQRPRQLHRVTITPRHIVEKIVAASVGANGDGEGWEGRVGAA